MARQIKITKHDTPQEWREKIRIIRDNEHKLKMLVIYKILTTPNVSGKYLQETYLISPATMFSWIAQYNEGGLEGLKKGGGEKGSGRGNKQADDEIYRALGKEIDNNQEQVWTLEKMQHFIKEDCTKIYYNETKARSF
jgi:transposase